MLKEGRQVRETPNQGKVMVNTHRDQASTGEAAPADGYNALRLTEAELSAIAPQDSVRALIEIRQRADQALAPNLFATDGAQKQADLLVALGAIRAIAVRAIGER